MDKKISLGGMRGNGGAHRRPKLLMNGVVRFMRGFQRFTVLSTRSAALNQWRAARRLGGIEQ